MKLSRHFSFALFTLFFTAQTYSQSSFLEKGQNGIGISGDYSSNQSASATGGSFGLSLSTFLDFGFNFGKISLAQKLEGQDVSASVNSPYLTFTLFKQNDSIPVSFAIGVAYVVYKYSSLGLDADFTSLERTGISLNGSLYGNIAVSSTIKLQPSVGVTYISIENSTTATDFDLGLTVLLQAGDGAIIGIGPSLALDKENTTFEIGAGVVFPF